MSTLKVNTVLSGDTPTVNVTDGLSVSGVSTLTGGLKVGTAVSIADNGNVGVSGIITASGLHPKQTTTSATGATTTGEILTRYEEGTWTPVVADAASGGNVAGSYGARSGWYTRIGNLVFVQWRMQAIDTTGMTGSNTLYVRGLPYTIKSATGRIVTGHVELSNVNVDGTSYNASIFANVGSSNNDFFRVFTNRDGNSHTSLTVSTFPDADNELNGNFFYETNAA